MLVRVRKAGTGGSGIRDAGTSGRRMPLLRQLLFLFIQELEHGDADDQNIANDA